MTAQEKETLSNASRLAKEFGEAVVEVAILARRVARRAGEGLPVKLPKRCWMAMERLKGDPEEYQTDDVRSDPTSGLAMELASRVARSAEDTLDPARHAFCIAEEHLEKFDAAIMRPADSPLD